MTKPVRNKTPEKAAALKDALVAACTDPRKAKSIKRVWAALEVMRQAGARDFRPPAVARELGEEGPALSTIRNKGGEPYQELIAAYAEEIAPAKRSTVAGADDDLPLAIDDLVLSARVAAVLAQNRALKRRNDLLHEQFTRLTADTAATTLTASAPAAISAPLPITPDMVRAVRTFVRGVPAFGWSIDEDSGAILDRHGSEIAPPYFVDALRALSAGEGNTADGQVSAERRLPASG